MIRACVLISLLISTTLTIECWDGIEAENHIIGQNDICVGHHWETKCCSYDTILNYHSLVNVKGRGYACCRSCSYIEANGDKFDNPVENCKECYTDYCNGATLLSIPTLAIFLSALAWLVMG